MINTSGYKEVFKQFDNFDVSVHEFPFEHSLQFFTEYDGYCMNKELFNNILEFKDCSGYLYTKTLYSFIGNSVDISVMNDDPVSLKEIKTFSIGSGLWDVIPSNRLEIKAHDSTSRANMCRISPKNRYANYQAKGYNFLDDQTINIILTEEQKENIKSRWIAVIPNDPSIKYTLLANEYTDIQLFKVEKNIEMSIGIALSDSSQASNIIAVQILEFKTQ